MDHLVYGIGVATIFVVCGVLLVFLIDCLSYSIHEATWVYKYKHRFDKPPTAACYCVDCKFHGDDIDSTRCTNRLDVVLQTADEWFCKAAEPKERGE